MVLSPAGFWKLASWICPATWRRGLVGLRVAHRAIGRDGNRLSIRRNGDLGLNGIAAGSHNVAVHVELKLSVAGVRHLPEGCRT